MEVARELADHIMERDRGLEVQVSSGTFTKEIVMDSKARESSSSSYILADDRSQFSRDIDRWMNGNEASAEITPVNRIGLRSPLAPYRDLNRSVNSTETAIQGSRVPMVQRSVLARSSSLDRSGLWYLLAMVLPLFSMNTCPHWRCTPSMVIHTAELCITHLTRVCGRARAHIRQLAQDQVARELFATAMDIVLVIYAIGFLVLSMYQASIFG